MACGGGSSVQTNVTPVTASPVASSSATQGQQLLHLRGYDATPDNFRNAIRALFISQDPTSFCNSIKGLSAQAVVDALAVPPLPPPSPPPNSTTVPGQTQNPDDANTAAQIMIDECNRVASVTTVSATASPAPHTAAEILASLQAAGLPIDATIVFDATTDGNQLLGRPGQYTAKASFHDSRLPPPSTTLDIDSGGSIETFANATDAQRRYDYLVGLGQASSLLVEYDYLKGTALLRIAHALTPDQANAYSTAFTQIVG